MAKPETPRKPAKKAIKAVAAPSKGETAAPAEIAPKSLEAKKTGRPSKYSPDIAQKMCNLLAEGIPLKEICRMEGFPAWRTIYDWMYRDDEAVAAGGGVGLSASIARAREIGYDALAEQCLIIADTPQMGKKTVYSSGAEEGKDSVTVTEEEMLGHRKLQIETRLKLLAKWDPKRFGDRVQLAGDAENPLKVEVESQAEKMMAALLQNIELKRQANGSR
jgi:hypothetical protein